MRSKISAGMNIRRLRTHLNMSQEHLAFEAAIDRTYVSGLERGIRNPSLDLLDRIALALGIETYELIMPTNNENLAGLKAGRKRKKQ